MSELAQGTITGLSKNTEDRPPGRQTQGSRQAPQIPRKEGVPKEKESLSVRLLLRGQIRLKSAH